MPDGNFQYCDVSLPVRLDQVFTDSLPETLRHRVRRGCRILVPFGQRTLVGVVVREEPALEEDLLALATCIASYYCAPLSEAMNPLSSVSKLFRSLALRLARLRRSSEWSG
jgi:primosomal protein N' (replication factor Y)